MAEKPVNPALESGFRPKQSAAGYAQADFTIDSENSEPKQIVEEIRGLLLL